MRCSARHPASSPSTTAASPAAGSTRRQPTGSTTAPTSWASPATPWSPATRRWSTTRTSRCPMRACPTALEAAGVRRIRVVLSHWHLDHVAGNRAFADCEIIAHARTDELLREHRAGDRGRRPVRAPAIDPLVLPTHHLRGHAGAEAGRRAGRVAPRRHPQRRRDRCWSCRSRAAAGRRRARRPGHLRRRARAAGDAPRRLAPDGRLERSRASCRTMATRGEIAAAATVPA